MQQTILQAFPQTKGCTEFQFLRHLISDAFLDQHLLPILNAHLEHSKSSQKSTAKRHAPINLEIWWQWFAEYLIREQKAKNNINTTNPKYDVNWTSPIGAHRFGAISTAHSLDLEELKDVLLVIREIVPPLVSMGTLSVVDETMFEYCGEDIREDGVAINIEGKPHPYGVMVYLAAQRLKHSGQSIMVDFEPQLPDIRPTPMKAKLSLMSWIKSRTRGPTHLLCDSLFSKAESLEEFRGLDTAFTVGLSKAPLCGLQDLYSIGCKDLPNLHARTFMSEPYMVQITHNGSHYVGVASTAWSIPETNHQHPSPRLSYATARYCSCMIRLPVSLKHSIFQPHLTGVTRWS